MEEQEELGGLGDQFQSHVQRSTSVLWVVESQCETLRTWGTFESFHSLHSKETDAGEDKGLTQD